MLKELRHDQLGCITLLPSFGYNFKRRFFLYSWLYRIRPAVVHKPWKRTDQGNVTNKFDDTEPNPAQVGCVRCNHYQILQLELLSFWS